MTEEKNSGAPQTWSDWVSFIGAILGTLAGLLSFALGYISLQRDRPDVTLALYHHPQMFRDLIAAAYPNVEFSGLRTRPEPHLKDWYVVTVTNVGNRPIRVQRLFVTSQRLGTEARFTYIVPFNRVLSEENRRASFAFEATYPLGHRFDAVRVEADNGDTFVIDKAETGVLMPRD